MNIAESSFPTLGKPEDEIPSSDWTLGQLGQYARVHDDHCGLVGRKLAVHRFREGWALSLAHTKVKQEQGYGYWGEFLKEHGISTSSDNRARTLYAKAQREENLVGLCISDAYEKYEIEKPKEKITATSKPSAKPVVADRTNYTEPQLTPTPSPKQTEDDEELSSEEDEQISESEPQHDPKPRSKSKEAERRKIEKAFDKLGAKKGWDLDKRIEVLVQLSTPDPWVDFCDELVEAGSSDIVVEQLHQYYSDEPDYLSLLLARVVKVVEAQSDDPSADALTSVNNAIAKLTHIRSAIMDWLGEEAVA